jgi:uncharacterized protein (TIRG00374 family)
MSKRKNTLRKGAARLVIGVILMGLVIWWVGLDKVVQAFARIQPIWIIPILGASYVGIAISCVRWKILLAARGIHSSVHRLVFYYIIGYFFSSFLPGMFGGDLVRSYVFGKHIKNQIESFASVFMERLSGLVGLVGIAFIASIINYRILTKVTFPFMVAEFNLALIMCIIFVAFVIFIVLLFNRPLIENMGKRLKWKKAILWRKRFLEFHDAIYFFRSQKGVVAKALFYSVLFQLFTSVNTYIVCLALQLDVRFLDIMVVVPVILLICTIPSTPGATGVWVLAFTIFFSRLGLSESAAASIGLVLRAKNIVIAILGGIFYMISGKDLRAQEAGDET